MKVLVGIPIRESRGEPMPKAKDCFEAMRKHSKHAIEMYCSTGQQITQNSLYICLKALQEGWDYLLYTGDDIIYPPWALDRMIEHNVDVVAGVCTYKTPPYWTTGMVEVEEGGYQKLLVTRSLVRQKAVIELDAVGSGFMLVSRAALEAVDDYFRNKVWRALPPDLRWVAPVPFFPVLYNADRNVVVGSDYSFCKFVKRAGRKVFMDCGVVCGHRYYSDYDVEDHWDWIDKFGFSEVEQPHPGAAVKYEPPPKAIYWGETGGPMDITVTSVGNRYHAQENIFPVLKSRLVDLDDIEQAGETSAGYIIGFHCSPEAPAKAYLQWAKRFERCLIQWTGSDIMNIGDATTPEEREVLNNGHFVHLVEDERLVPEVKAYFKNVRVLLLPTVRQFPIAPMPQNFTVFVYYPKHRHDFHYGDVLKGVIESMPDVTFKLAHLHGGPPDFEFDNMRWLGNLNAEQYARELATSSCMLRLSQHDGNPTSCREAALMGRRVITNFDFDGTWKTDDPPTVANVVATLRNVANYPEPDKELAEKYRKKNDFREFRRKVANLAGIDEAVGSKRKDGPLIVPA